MFPRRLVQFFMLFSATCVGQTVAGSPFLQQLQANSQTGLSIRSYEMTGAADWVAGSTIEHGTADLTAALDGSYTIILNLTTASRNETGSAFDVGRTCQWTDSHGTAHAIVGLNCIAATSWFQPTLFTSAGSQLPTGIRLSDDGETSWNGTNVHQISYTLAITGDDATETAAFTQATRVKIFFDLQSLLPRGLEYSVHPDNDDSRSFPVDVAFSDYRAVGGVMLPFHIVKSLNKTPQLTLSFSNITTH